MFRWVSQISFFTHICTQSLNGQLNQIVIYVHIQIKNSSTYLNHFEDFALIPKRCIREKDFDRRLFVNDEGVAIRDRQFQAEKHNKTRAVPSVNNPTDNNKSQVQKSLLFDDNDVGW